MKPAATTAANFNQHEVGYVTAHIALPYKTDLYTADQLRAAQVAILREAAMKFRGDIGYNPVAADGYSNAFDIAAELEFMAFELEATAPTPRNPDEAACTARTAPGQGTPNA